MAARVEIVAGADCHGQASVVKAPEHCDWPESARRSFLVSTVVEVVTHVGPDGKPDGAHLVRGPAGYDFDAAAVACALRSEYRAQVDENGAAVEGDTCPVSFRLERYAQDIGTADPPALSCPPVQTLRTPEFNRVLACGMR